MHDTKSCDTSLLHMNNDTLSKTERVYVCVCVCVCVCVFVCVGEREKERESEREREREREVWVYFKKRYICKDDPGSHGSQLVGHPRVWCDIITKAYRQTLQKPLC